MKLIVDSREKEHAIRGILAWFDRNGIEWEKRKLDVGDYMIEDRPGLAVDRKQSLNELAMNLCSPDHRRFYNEIRRAHDAGVRLTILCEQYGIHSFDDIANWRNKYGKVSGRRLQDAIFQLEMAYAVPVVFCDKRSTGRRIIEILTEQTEERHG